MSHDATGWAIKVRGLKPATKLVLWHLADRFHPDHGCFPSQHTLSHDCEMSRASLNVHLKILEKSGIIKREKRFNEYTKQAESTLYILNFKATRVQNLDTAPVSRKQAIPCPEFGESRVQNLDTNNVIEPVIEPVMPQTGLRTPSPSDDLDKILYQRGKHVLGPKAGGQLTKLKGLVGIGRSLELIDQSSRKENPNEYIAGIIRNEATGRRGKSAQTIRSAAELADAIIAQREATGIRY